MCIKLPLPLAPAQFARYIGDTGPTAAQRSSLLWALRGLKSECQAAQHSDRFDDEQCSFVPHIGRSWRQQSARVIYTGRPPVQSGIAMSGPCRPLPSGAGLPLAAASSFRAVFANLLLLALRSLVMVARAPSGLACRPPVSAKPDPWQPATLRPKARQETVLRNPASHQIRRESLELKNHVPAASMLGTSSGGRGDAGHLMMGRFPQQHVPTVARLSLFV